MVSHRTKLSNCLLTAMCVSCTVTMHVDSWWPYGYCARHFSSHLLCIKDLTLLSTHLGGLSAHTLTHAHKHSHTSNRTFQLSHSIDQCFPTFFCLRYRNTATLNQKCVPQLILYWKSFSIIIHFT